MRRHHAQFRPRRGAAWPAVVWALFVAGTVVTTAVVVTPRYLRADPPTSVPARAEKHRQVFEAFTMLVSRSKEVVTINQRGATPFLEIVLWLEDKENLGVIDVEEVAVITHSEVMQTITMHIVDPASGAGAETAPRTAEPEAETPKTLTRSDIRAGEFCAGFRDAPGVTRRLLAKGVARMDAEPLPDSSAGRTMLRISFIWDDESADGGDEASALMDVHLRTDDDAQTE